VLTGRWDSNSCWLSVFFLKLALPFMRSSYRLALLEE